MQGSKKERTSDLAIHNKEESKPLLALLKEIKCSCDKRVQVSDLCTHKFKRGESGQLFALQT